MVLCVNKSWAFKFLIDIKESIIQTWRRFGIYSKHTLRRSALNRRHSSWGYNSYSNIHSHKASFISRGEHCVIVVPFTSHHNETSLILYIYLSITLYRHQLTHSLNHHRSWLTSPIKTDSIHSFSTRLNSTHSNWSLILLLHCCNHFIYWYHPPYCHYYLLYVCNFCARLSILCPVLCCTALHCIVMIVLNCIGHCIESIVSTSVHSHHTIICMYTYASTRVCIFFRIQ